MCTWGVVHRWGLTSPAGPWAERFSESASRVTSFFGSCFMVRATKNRSAKVQGRSPFRLDQVVIDPEVLSTLVAKKNKRPPPQVRVRSTPTRQAVAALVQEKVPKLTARTEGISRLLGQYVDPASHKPLRLPDVSSASCVGTAVSTLFVADTLNWTTTVPTITDCPAWGFGDDLPEPILSDPTQRLVVAMRDPVVMGIVSAGPWSVATPSVYKFISPTSNPLQAPVSVWKEDTTFELGSFPLISGPTRYGSHILPGMVSEGAVQVVWLDASVTRPCVVNFSITFLFATQNYVNSFFRAVQWIDENESATFSVERKTISAGTLTWTHTLSVTRSGYHSFSLSLDNYQQADNPLFMSGYYIELSVATALSYDHVVHPSVLGAITGAKGKELIGQARVLGSAALISNSTAEMFKAGTLYSKQIDARDPWFRDIQTAEDFSSTNVATSYDGPMSKGLFAIVKPQGPQSFDLLEVVDANGYGHERYCFRPFMGCGTVVTLLCPGDSSTVSGSPSTSVVIHWARGFEFTTQNQLFLVDVSKVPRIDMLSFMDELSRFPQFFENPLHLKDIGALMKKAGMWAWDNKATIVEVARLLATLSKVAAAA